jgi:hypothetical protein
MTLKQHEGMSLSTKSREVAMKEVARYRALGSLCRQHAAYNPNESWKLLAQAEHWEHLAAQELAFHFKECNADHSAYSTDTGGSQIAGGSRWKTIVAA